MILGLHFARRRGSMKPLALTLAGVAVFGFSLLNAGMLITAIGVVAMAAIAIAAAFHRTHRRPQAAILAVSMALWLWLVSDSVHLVLSLAFCAAWCVALCVMVKVRKLYVEYAVSVVALIVVILAIVLTSVGSASDNSHTHADAVTPTTLPYKGNTGGTSSSSPAFGDEASNTTDLRPSLDDGEGPVASWRELVARVNAQPAGIRQAYIEAINARSASFGTWSDVLRYAEIEEETGVDTRVILALNTDVTEQLIRHIVREVVGGQAAGRLPIVYTTGELINTRGVDVEKIKDFRDGRSQVRVILTVPTASTTTVKLVANIAAARQGRGILVECRNPSTGIVRKPTPHPTGSITTQTTTSPSPSVTRTTPSNTPPVTPPKTTSPTPTPSMTPTTAPPTTAPPTTHPTPPVTTSPTPSPTPSATSPSPTPPATTPTKGPVPYPTEKPSDGPPPGSTESTPPVESHPADPTTRPGDEATEPAPGATQATRSPAPSREPSVAPHPTTPGTGDVDPDAAASSTSGQQASSVLARVAVALGVLWVLVSSRRRRTFN